MSRKHRGVFSKRSVLLSTVVVAAWPALAAEVTPQRWPIRRPHNWLMTTHLCRPALSSRSTDQQGQCQEHSSSPILRLRFVGTRRRNENLEATHSVEDGFMYVVDLWASSTRSTSLGKTFGPHRLAHDPPAGEIPARQSRAALWGNFVISSPAIRLASSRPQDSGRGRLG